MTSLSQTSNAPPPRDVIRRQGMVGRVLVSTVIILLVVVIGWLIVTSGAIKWDTVWQYLFAPPVLAGFLVTLELTILAMVIGIVLVHTVAAKLGLEVNWNYSEFAGILPAMQAKRYDFAIASMGDTPERQKVVDFVDYSTESNSIVTTVGNPKGITGMDSLCGLKISSVEGSVMLGLLEEQNKKCDPKMEITIFPDNANALLQVQTGRADATMYQTGTTAYLIKTNEAAKNLLIVDNTEFGKGYNAMPFSKDNSELRDLVQKALIGVAVGRRLPGRACHLGAREEHA